MTGALSLAVTLESTSDYSVQPSEGTVGEYAFDRSSKALEWVSGPLSNGFDAKYMGLNSTGYTIQMNRYIDGRRSQLWCYRRR
jgi:hypothetical protein